MKHPYRNFAVEVDSPQSRASDWDAYCNGDAGDSLPPSICSRGNADDVSETWNVYARSKREALAIAKRTASRLGVNVLDEEDIWTP